MSIDEAIRICKGSIEDGLWFGSSIVNAKALKMVMQLVEELYDPERTD